MNTSGIDRCRQICEIKTYESSARVAYAFSKLIYLGMQPCTKSVIVRFVFTCSITFSVVPLIAEDPVYKSEM